MPLTVRNPLNNEIIVGEVEFYLLKKESVSPISGLQALFIGTDFNYANSNEFRKMFLEYCVESDDLKSQVRGLNSQADEDASDGLNSVMRELRNNQEFNDYAQQLLRI